MKIFLIIVLLIGLSATVVQAKCDPAREEIALKTSQRNWVGDFNKLKTKYKKLNINQIRSFFFDQEEQKECISFAELQDLKSKVDDVFKGKKDRDINEFVIGITGAAKANKPGKSGDVDSKKAGSIEEKTNSTSLLGDEMGTTQDVVSDGTDTTSGLDSAAGKNGEEDSDKTDKTDQTSTEWPWLTITFGILSLALGGLALWLNSRIEHQRRHEADLKDQERSILDNLQRQFDKVSKEKIEKLTAENDELRRNNKELVEELRQSKQQVGAGTLTVTTSAVALAESANPSSSVPLMPEPPVAKAFFLSTPTPTSDGLCTFLDQRKAQFDPTSSLYRFELINNNENQAQFRFESTSGTVSGALSYPDTYLQPACEYTGLDSKATQIDTVQPGKAIRQSNVWKVTEKARIKFV